MHQKIRLNVLLFFVICVAGLNAQTNLNVKVKTGTITTFTLSDVAKLTFSSGNMIINRKDATNSTFFISDIRNLNFGLIEVISGSPKITHSESNKLSLYPIPALDRVTIQFLSTTSGSAELQLIDLNGKTVLQQTFDCQFGINYKSFNVSQLKHGLYLCRLQHDSKFETSKFIKN